MESPLRVALLGLGHLYPRSYMLHFQRTATTQAVAVSEPISELRETFARDFGVAAYPGWPELLAAEKIDLAYIFLPHCACAEAAVACAERGIHVVVEKPVAHTPPPSLASWRISPSSGAINAKTPSQHHRRW